LFNRAKAGNEDTNWQNYKHELAWHSFCSDIEIMTDTERLRNILSPLGYLQRAKESWSDSSKELLDLPPTPITPSGVVQTITTEVSLYLILF